MKMVVEKLVDGKQEFEVVEAENAAQAVNACDQLKFNDEGKPVIDKGIIGYVGVYEMGQINLLDLTAEKTAIHDYYQEKFRSLGIDPDTFEKI